MVNITLINDDCLTAMRNVPDDSIDAVICDLPYGTTSCTWDAVIPFEALWEQYRRMLKPSGAAILFGQEPFSSMLRASNLKDYKYDIYWEKEKLTNIQQVKRRVGKTVETISVFYSKQCSYNPQMKRHDGPLRRNSCIKSPMGALVAKGNLKVKEYHDTGLRYPTQVWRFPRDMHRSNLHPTQKPLALMEELVKTFTNEGDTVLDNAMGSGTTGVACKLLGRNFVGMELDEGYFDTARDRIGATAENGHLTVQGENVDERDGEDRAI